MHHPHQRRIALREFGRRRVARATRAVAVAGTALAALFGVAFAKSTAAAPAVSPPATSETPGGADTGGGRLSHKAPPLTGLKPPREVPQPYGRGNGGASSAPS